MRLKNWRVFFLQCSTTMDYSIKWDRKGIRTSPVKAIAALHLFSYYLMMFSFVNSNEPNKMGRNMWLYIWNISIKCFQPLQKLFHLHKMRFSWSNIKVGFSCAEKKLWLLTKQYGMIYSRMYKVIFTYCSAHSNGLLIGKHLVPLNKA